MSATLPVLLNFGCKDSMRLTIPLRDGRGFKADPGVFNLAVILLWPSILYRYRYTHYDIPHGNIPIPHSTPYINTLTLINH